MIATAAAPVGTCLLDEGVILPNTLDDIGRNSLQSQGKLLQKVVPHDDAPPQLAGDNLMQPRDVAGKKVIQSFPLPETLKADRATSHVPDLVAADMEIPRGEDFAQFRDIVFQKSIGRLHRRAEGAQPMSSSAAQASIAEFRERFEQLVSEKQLGMTQRRDNRNDLHLPLRRILHNFPHQVRSVALRIGRKGKRLRAHPAFQIQGYRIEPEPAGNIYEMPDRVGRLHLPRQIQLDGPKCPRLWCHCKKDLIIGSLRA